jgi:hypothetical protein
VLYISNFRARSLVQKVLCVFSEISGLSFNHPVIVLKKIAGEESAIYIQQHMKNARGFYTSKELFDYVIPMVKEGGLVIEFGVYSGGTINYLANKFKNRQIYGFDSFEGLPEMWSGEGLQKGSFSLAGLLPKVNINVVLIKGWFDESIPNWIKTNNQDINLIHIDCDIYSSTKIIFNEFKSKIKIGSIIVFDEYFGYPNWQEHEFKAFKEFIKDTNLKYEYLGYARTQVAVRIIP